MNAAPQHFNPPMLRCSDRAGSGSAHPTRAWGHRSSVRQILADRLGLDGEARWRWPIRMKLREEPAPSGHGPRSRRSTALWRTMDAVVDKLAHRAAEMLEVAREDLAFDHGTYRVAGTDTTLAFPAVLAAEPVPVAAEHVGAADGVTFPNGLHVCERDRPRDGRRPPRPLRHRRRRRDRHQPADRRRGRSSAAPSRASARRSRSGSPTTPRPGSC